jgi:hypothetical protein
MLRLLFLALFFASSTLAQSAPAVTGSINYGGGRVYATGVYRPRLIAELPVPGSQPFLVFSGFGCDECDININIFIRSASDGPIERPEMDSRHVYPGTYRTYDTNELVQRVRTFVGRCTTSSDYGVVWFLETKLEDGTWHNGTYLAQVEGEKLALRPDPEPSLSLAAAQAAVAKRACREIPGKNLTTEP